MNLVADKTKADEGIVITYSIYDVSTGTLRYAKISDILNQIPQVQWLRRFIFIHGYMYSYTHTFVCYIFYFYFLHTHHLCVYMYCIYTLCSTYIYYSITYIIGCLSFKRGDMSFKFNLQL